MDVVPEVVPGRHRRRRDRRGSSAARTARASSAAQEIVRAAAQVFAERGYNGGSLRSIGERVGVSSASLVQYFGTKERLLAAVLEEWARESRPAGADGLRGLAWLRSMREAMVYNSTHRGLVELFLTLTAEATNPDHPARAFVQHRYATVVAEHRRHLHEAVADGEVRPLSEAEVELEARLFVAGAGRDGAAVAARPARRPAGAVRPVPRDHARPLGRLRPTAHAFLAVAATSDPTAHSSATAQAAASAAMGEVRGSRTQQAGLIPRSSTHSRGVTSAGLAGLELTYAEVGATSGTLPPGYHHLDVSRVVGQGRDWFDVAAARVLTWEVQRRAGLSVDGRPRGRARGAGPAADAGRAGAGPRARGGRRRDRGAGPGGVRVRDARRSPRARRGTLRGRAARRRRRRGADPGVLAPGPVVHALRRAGRAAAAAGHRDAATSTR